jgi:hypothetical protein
MAEIVTAPVVTPPAQPPDVNPETHDPVSGKSWKELAREQERKATEHAAEIARMRSHPPAQPPRDSNGPMRTVEDYDKDLNDRFVENPAVAMRTAVGHGIDFAIRSMTNARKLIKETSRDLQKRYKDDFAELRDEFESALDDAPPGGLSKDGIEMVFQSLRASYLEKKVEEIKAKSAASAPASPTIIGPTSPSAAPVTTGGSSKMTEDQREEMDNLGLSEEAYLRTIKQRRENAKKQGIPDHKLPNTLKEPLNRSKD